VSDARDRDKHGGYGKYSALHVLISPRTESPEVP
jgi:hypothetical protein